MYIRKATIEDTRRISYLIRRNTEEVLENGYSPDQKAVWIRANTTKSIKNQIRNRHLFCAFKGNELVGVIGLDGNEVVGLYVSYSLRGRGIGRMLLDFLIEFAQTRGLKYLTLTATPSAKKFYQSKGFDPIEEVNVMVSDVVFKETLMHRNL